MRILGLEVKLSRRENAPGEDKLYGSLATLFSEKGKDYLFGLEGGPFSLEKGQGYLHYDGLTIKGNRLCFMWRGDKIMSRRLIGGTINHDIYISGITGKQEITLS